MTGFLVQEEATNLTGRLTRPRGAAGRLDTQHVGSNMLSCRCKPPSPGFGFM
ncbi:hypothetical protein LX36DRAFT_662137 [Colletotrichum falcatum]|nr:hypothetical protein LX36DRAFT_662137 [Colletotrichum falcatum]